jgi:serine protease inhibitor
MMTQKFERSDQHPSIKVRYIDSKHYQALRLPYRWSTISAVIVLPSKQLASKGIAAAAAQLPVGELLAAATWNNLDHNGLELLLPKFTVKSKPTSLKKV